MDGIRCSHSSYRGLIAQRYKRMEPVELIAEYRRGPELLRGTVRGLTDAELDAVPVAKLWSIRQVVCHLADCELVYADRIKRVLAEDNPVVAGLNPDEFQRSLYSDQRHLENELSLIESTRRHLADILDRIDVESYQRTAVHSEDGPLTLETLLERITRHIPHHLGFIEDKKRALETT